MFSGYMARSGIAVLLFLGSLFCSIDLYVYFVPMPCSFDTIAL